MERRIYFRSLLREEPDGSGGLAPLGHGLVLGCELGEERAQGVGGGWGNLLHGNVYG
jgi:hypothetical protein